MASFESMQGNFLSAYDHLWQSVMLKDSVFDEESDRRIGELQMIFEIKT
ncbi:MAG: hypothetical protein H0S84_07400 [Bacteroidales bacterium]|jgi:hypothetical protein|nr:hypothetical protein [Bacteroidales bacterium]